MKPKFSDLMLILIYILKYAKMAIITILVLKSRKSELTFNILLIRSLMTHVFRYLLLKLPISQNI